MISYIPGVTMSQGEVIATLWFSGGGRLQIFFSMDRDTASTIARSAPRSMRFFVVLMQLPSGGLAVCLTDHEKATR